MLAETIDYDKDLPFKIGYSQVMEEDPHYHKELEIILVLKGSLKYKMNHLDYSLSEGDILIADTEDFHRIHDGSDDILLLMMHIDLEYFTELYPNIDFMIFACDEAIQESDKKHETLQNKTSLLKHHLAKIMIAYDDPDADLLEYINDFIFVLVNQFQGFFIENKQFITDHGDTNDIELERLYRIIKFIYNNYDRRIGLDDLASLEHLSPYYISHMIKDTTGLSFQNFLNYIRVEYAEKFLWESKLSLTQISEQCGFSSPAYFNRCFKEWYSITPAEYKKSKTIHGRTHAHEISKTVARKLLRSYLSNQTSKDAMRKVSQHIFIPVRKNFVKGKDIEKTFVFKLSVHAKDLKNKLDSVNSVLEALPGETDILMDSSGIDYSGESFADAFLNILHKKKLTFYLNALITPKGLYTPYYFICNLIKGVDGVITELRDQYMIVKGKEKTFLFIVNADSENLLKVHISLDGFGKNGYMLRRTFEENSSKHKIISSPLTEDIKKHLNLMESGIRDILPFSEEDIYMELSPKTLLYIEIIYEAASALAPSD